MARRHVIDSRTPHPFEREMKNGATVMNEAFLVMAPNECHSLVAFVNADLLLVKMKERLNVERSIGGAVALRR